MSLPKTRGISIVRTVQVSVPNRKEPQKSLRQFMVRCNASIPPSHKDFQNQYISEASLEPVRFEPKKQGAGKAQTSKLQVHKAKYA